MKRTEIKYKRISKTKVRIIEILNCANGISLGNEFDYETKKEYFTDFPHYLSSQRTIHPLRINIVQNRNEYPLQIRVGERFQRIKKEVQANEIKTIII